MKGRVKMSHLPRLKEFSKCFTLLQITPIWQHIHRGTKLLQFSLPIIQCGTRSNH
jgi:hypothetical protein